MKRARKARIGRPPRTDDPVTLTVIVPRALRKWLKIHAAQSEHDMGDIVTRVLGDYRERLGKGGRR